MVEKRKIFCRCKSTIWIWGLAIVLCLLLGSNALAKKGQMTVQDKAGLFTAGETAQLEKTAAELADNYEMNICIVTLDDASGMSSAEAAENFYEENGYVDDGSRGGIVLLIDMDNREINLVTSRDMIYYITDSREEAIYDAGYDYVADGEYGLGMQAMLEKTAYFLKKGIPDKQYTYDTETGRIVRHRSLSAADWLLAVGGAAILAGCCCFGVRRSYCHVKAYEYTAGGNAKMNLTKEQDQLVNQTVTRRRIPKMPPPDAGGDSGDANRSSTHTSSHGNTFGGGSGRKF